MRVILDCNSALDSIDRERDLFGEHWDHSLVFQDSIKFLEGLNMYSCSNWLLLPLQMDSWTKRLEAYPHPSRWIAGLSVRKLLSFCNSREKFKIFIPSFLRCFDWNHAFDYANINSVLKMNFLLNINTYFYPSL